MESMFGIHGGMGDRQQIRERMDDIRAQVNFAETEPERLELQRRLGRMNGGTAILRVGALHETEREARKAVAMRGIAGLRNAMAHGVASGGGAAFIHAQRALQNMPARTGEERVARKMLMRAMEEPLRALALNAGAQPDLMVEQVRVAPCGHGLDVRTAQIVDCMEAGILDSAFVLQKAIDIAVSGAMMALTTDVIVHHRAPIESLEP